MSLDTAVCSTSTGAYTKLLVPVKVMRAGTKVGSSLGRAVRVLEPSVRPQETIFIKSTTSRRRIQINIHRNKAAIEAGNKPTAVHLNWHGKISFYWDFWLGVTDAFLGSGWILKQLGTDAAFMRQVLANPVLASYPLTILDCDYAKSPEYPCPADIEDGRDAIDYVLAHPEKYDPNKLTIGGFSAGATIALGLSVEMGREAREKTGSASFVHPIKAVFSVYPVATWQGPRDTVKVPPQILKGMPGMVLPLWFSKYITRAHLFSPVRNSGLSKDEEMNRKKELIARPSVSPACGETTDFSPIVVLYTAEYDHLSRETEKLRERFAQEPKIKLYGRKIIGVGHGWDQMVKKNQVGYVERGEAYDAAARMIAMVGGLDVAMKN
jgi:acetyl esterase/lipase